MFKLVISDDEGKTTVVPLVRDEITIGRQEGNTIRLTERNVSRRHARLSKANGAFAVEDLESYNGVKVNGRKIDASVSLNAGDQITIGDYLLALQMDAIDGVVSRTSAPPHDAKTAMLQAPEEPRPPARLVMLSPPAPGAEFALSKSLLRIGRAEDLDAWVNHRSISREHAEISRDGESFQIRDLGSANGVRVNGKDVQRAALKPGDVLELGQVRFRFVGEGEQYIFDSDRTIQVDAVEAPSDVSRAPIVAALSIILLAVVVAAVLSIGAPPPIVTQPNPDVEPPPDEFSAALTGCQEALGRGDHSRALALADEALSINSSSTDASNCRSEAEQMQADQAAFERGLEATQNADPDRALEAFEEISTDSPLREAAEIGEARLLWMGHRIRDARAALVAENNTEARRLAQEVLQAPFVDSDHRRQAEAILRRLAPANRPPGAREPVRPPPTMQAPTSMVDVPSSPTARSPVESCREQFGFGTDYSRCIIQNVPPASQSDLLELIEAHRHLGNTNAAQGMMRLFVQRYPQHPRSPQYRQILNAQR